MTQDQPEHLAVLLDGLHEAPLRPTIQFALLGFWAMLQNSSRHHGRQRQGDERRKYDRDGESYGKFPEQATDYIRHEKEGNQNGDQRDRQRNDGESDLRRALQSRLHGGFPHLDIARDVFDHDDGIIHDETGGNRQRHQGKVIQAVSEQIHDGECAYQRKRHGNARDDGGRSAAQKQKDDHHNERGGEQEFELDILHRCTDRRCAVRDNSHGNASRQGRFDLGQEGLDRVHHTDDVCPGLPLNIQNDSAFVVHPSGKFRVFRAVDDRGDV